jgi:hypothetical protein
MSMQPIWQCIGIFTFEQVGGLPSLDIVRQPARFWVTEIKTAMHACG